MQVFTIEQAAKRGLYTICPLTGRQIPFNSFRIELTDEQRKEHEKLIQQKVVPF